MADDIVMLNNATHISEFVPNSSGGTWTGTCGETALTVAILAMQGIPVKPGDIDYVTHDMINKGLAEANGASWISSLAAYVKQRSDWGGANSIMYEHDYESDDWDESEWLPLLRTYAGTSAIVLNIARGGNLIDTETGVQDEIGVQYHFICIVGKQSNGYICVDGDNPQAGDRFQIYNKDTLASAKPCGMLVLNLGGTTVTTSNLPNGWSDDGKTLTAPNDITIQDGFRMYCLAHIDWLASVGNPVCAPYPTDDVGGDGQHPGAGAECIFNLGGLGWTQNENVFVLWTGLMYNNAKTAVDAANDNVTTLNKQLADAQNQITALQAEVASLKNGTSSGSSNAITKADFVAFIAAMNDVVQKI